MRTILLAVAACVACLGHPLDALSLRGQRMEADGVEAASGGRPLKRVRRGWMWNQFFLQEEYTGSERQYIGKVRVGHPIHMLLLITPIWAYGGTQALPLMSWKDKRCVKLNLVARCNDEQWQQMMQSCCFNEQLYKSCV